MPNIGGDHAGLLALISVVIAGWALVRSAEANTIARRAL
jgi:hypothetical protein